MGTPNMLGAPTVIPEAAKQKMLRRRGYAGYLQEVGGIVEVNRGVRTSV